MTVTVNRGLLCTPFYSGFEAQTPEGTRVIHASLLLTTQDLPAKAIMANMKQYNGAYGCSVCEDKGQTIGPSGLRRVWPHHNSILRTEETVLAHGQEASLTGQAVG